MEWLWNNYISKLFAGKFTIHLNISGEYDVTIESVYDNDIIIKITMDIIQIYQAINSINIILETNQK